MRAGAQVGTPERVARVGRFVAVELEDERRNQREDAIDVGRRGIDEQADRRHERRQGARQLRGAFRREATRAGRVEDEADGVGAGLDRGIDVGLPRDTADLDPRPLVHDATRVAPARSGQPVHRRGSIGDRMGGIVVRAQEVEAVGREGRRRERAVARRQHLGEPGRGRAPLPTATRQPTTLRIM